MPTSAPPTPALTAASGHDPIDPGDRGQRIEGVVVEVCDEPPAHGALGIAWVATVAGSSSILDLRGLVLWPGTSVTAGARHCPGPGSDLVAGMRVRAWASAAEYWSIPPMFDALRIDTGP